ncbi:hypothetical protein KCP74_16525 [Salmonella enterica subsp. enterica]|nr:hypothetical protein KCP74_16525 [Salmonella enterica subsp. enterica]
MGLHYMRRERLRDNHFSDIKANEKTKGLSLPPGTNLCTVCGATTPSPILWGPNAGWAADDNSREGWYE